MCGIIGISSNKPVSASIISSLKKLEYRGYDSAGIATLLEGEIKEVSKICNFVEVKKSTVGQISKVNHLSYIGDT